MQSVRFVLNGLVSLVAVVAVLLPMGCECTWDEEVVIESERVVPGLPDGEQGSFNLSLLHRITSSNTSCDGISFNATEFTFVFAEDSLFERGPDNEDGTVTILYTTPGGLGHESVLTVTSPEVASRDILLRAEDYVPGDAGVVDGGADDAGMQDAGAADAGDTDSGFVDAGAQDAGTADAGGADAGTQDAGVMDAGVADGGLVDAGPLDAGQDDGGMTDAGLPQASRAAYELFGFDELFDLQGQRVTFLAEGPALFSSTPSPALVDTPGTGTSASVVLVTGDGTEATALPLGQTVSFLGADVDTLYLDPFGVVSDVPSSLPLPGFPSDATALFIDEDGLPRNAVAFFYSDLPIVFGTTTFDVFDDRWVLSLENAPLGDGPPLSAQVRGFVATGDVEVTITAGIALGTTVVGVADVAAGGVAPAESDLVESFTN